MRKVLLSMATMLAFVFCAYAQPTTCLPDSMFLGAGAGVFPLPDTTNGQDPTLGINTDAFVNCYWEYTWTAVVPDSLAVSGTVASLDYVLLKSISGLPSDIGSGAGGYVCDPPDCKFLANTIGCVTVYGTTTDAPGDYDAVITTDVLTGLLPTPLEIEFPNATLAPGIYRLTVLPEPAGGCTAGVNDLDGVFGLAQANPNPFSSYTNINFTSKVSTDAEFKVYNLLGKMIYSETINVLNGDNTVQFNGSDLNSGVYMYSIGKGNDIVTNRIVVNK